MCAVVAAQAQPVAAVPMGTTRRAPETTVPLQPAVPHVPTNQTGPSALPVMKLKSFAPLGLLCGIIGGVAIVVFAAGIFTCIWHDSRTYRSRSHH